MKTAMKLLAVPALAVFVAVSMPARANHPWGSYHWAVVSLPVTLQLGDNLSTAEWKKYLSQASNSWNGVATTTPPGDLGSLASESPIKNQIVGGKGGNTCAAVAGTTQVCNKTYGNNGWLGLAQIWTSGDHILQGTAKMNDTYFKFATYNNPNEKLHVMCQEVAHTFGLGHQSTSGAIFNTCMDYYKNNGGADTVSTTPNMHDFGQLKDVYNHADSSTTISTAMAALASVPSHLEDPRDWGSLVKQSREGRSSIYARDYKGGIRILTHVTWTEEAASKCANCDHRFEVRE